MKRANTFDVIPQSPEDEELLRRLLDASAALWNEINYERRENEDTTRHHDTLTCLCGFEGHADLTASETFLRRQTTVTRSMARPVCLKWDDHNWSESPRSVPNEEHTNPQVASVSR